MNLYPYYRDLIESQRKFTSVRLGNRATSFNPGQIITITLGWEEDAAVEVTKARVEDVKVVHLGDLKESDLAGESPDCLRPEAVKYVLSSIYRTILHDKDEVTIIRWRYLD